MEKLVEIIFENFDGSFGFFGLLILIFVCGGFYLKVKGIPIWSKDDKYVAVDTYKTDQESVSHRINSRVTTDRYESDQKTIFNTLNEIKDLLTDVPKREETDRFQTEVTKQFKDVREDIHRVEDDQKKSNETLLIMKGQMREKGYKNGNGV